MNEHDREKRTTKMGIGIHGSDARDGTKAQVGIRPTTKAVASSKTGRGMNMTNCTGCNEPIDKYPAGAYGGDWYASCDICEWHCEEEGHSSIKQGLTLEELVAHKKRLNKLYDRLHRYAFPLAYDTKDGQVPEYVMLELRNIMNELIDKEE